MAKKKPKVATITLPEEKLYTCMCCGKEKENPVSNFYKTRSKLYTANDGYVPICRSCLNEMFEVYRKRYDEVTAVRIICHYLDIPFFYSLYTSVVAASDNFTIGMYVRQMNNKQYASKTFVNTLIDKKELGIEQEAYDKIKEDKWGLQELRAKNDVIDIVGYDPFEGYDEQQRRFLFNNIIGYLGEDGIEDDTYKISQIVQLVNNNYQIEQVNKTMAKLNPQINAADFKDLNSMKKQLVDSNDKIAKENGISVKNRLDRQAGRSSFGSLQRYLRELNFSEAEANYYSQLKGEGSQWAANMSLKAIKENGFFDENDGKDMLEFQYKKIQELQNRLDDAEEENRLLLIENGELKESKGKKNGT